MPAVALLDRDTVAGAVRFHFEAKANNIKPIIGSEITMDDGSLLPLVPMFAFMGAGGYWEAGVIASGLLGLLLLGGAQIALGLFKNGLRQDGGTGGEVEDAVRCGHEHS